MTEHLRISALFLALGFLGGGAAGQDTAKDEQQLRKSTSGYADAFNKGDMEGVLSFWADDADYIDDAGKHHKGKAAIGALFRKNRESVKGHRLAFKILSIKFLKPDIAVEDGRAESTSPAGFTETTRYTAVWTKVKGKWLISSVRNLGVAAADETGPYRHLKQLDWMVGEWTGEGDAGAVTVTCRWTMQKSFLVKRFSVKNKDGEAFSVFQRIGWDPLTQQIKTWVFDSRGGYGVGLWSRKGNEWTVQAAGVLPEGDRASGTHTWRYVDDKTCVWTSIHREVDGQPVGDVMVKFKRVK